MNNVLSLLQKYKSLRWKIIPLQGKRPFWDGWSSPEKWQKGKYSTEKAAEEILSSGLNVGVVTGELSGIIGIDVDQPRLTGLREDKVRELMKKGVLAHTTSKAPRLIFRSSNPEVLNFNRKLVRRKEELSDEERELLVGDEDKQAVTLIEVLGSGRQFVAPPSIHPETGEPYRWLTPLPDNPEDIYEIKDLNELRKLLFELFERGDLVAELFEGDIKQRAIAETGERGEKAEEILNEWLEVLLKHLEVAEDRGSYILLHCPFHKPDKHPSAAIYRNSFLFVCFHDTKSFTFTLKQLAEELGIELPRKRREKRTNEAWIPLKYEELDFGWLHVVKVSESDFVARVINKDGQIAIPARNVKQLFITQPRLAEYFFGPIKKALVERYGEIAFNKWFGKIQETTIRKMNYLKLELPDPAEVEGEELFDMATLKEFGIESVDEAKALVERFVNESGLIHSEVAEFLLSRFSIKTLLENDEVLLYENGVYRMNGERKLKEIVQRLLKALGLAAGLTRHKVDEIVAYIKRETYTPLNEFMKFNDLELVNLKNGVLDLTTMELRPHSPEYLFLWQLPVEYRPEADCPRIKKFVSEIVREQDVDTLLKLSAYVLMPGQPFKIAFYLYGGRDNGKSTFLNLLARFFGKENIASVPLQEIERNRFAGHELVDKLVNLSSETPGEQLDELKVFKRITGGDPIFVEKKFKDGYSVYVRCKLIFAGNRLPQVTHLDEATISRWILIEFPFKFKKNPKLLDELTTEDELSGFFNLLLNYYKKLKEEGFESVDVEESRRVWLRLSNPLQAFVHEKVEATFESEVEKDAIWEAFYEWCNRHNIPFPYKGSGGKARFFEAFYKILKNNGIWFEQQRIRVGDDRVFVIKGIELVDKEEEREAEIEAEILEEDGFYVCSRCGVRFLTKEDGEAHLETARDFPEVCRPKKEVEEEEIDLSSYLDGG